MRRSALIYFHLAAGVSLLLCLAMIGGCLFVQPSEPPGPRQTPTSILPMVFLASLFAILPLAASMRLARRRRRAKRLNAGHCIACGYDLRASPDRCPECGLPAPSAIA